MWRNGWGSTARLLPVCRPPPRQWKLHELFHGSQQESKFTRSCFDGGAGCSLSSFGGEGRGEEAIIRDPVQDFAGRTGESVSVFRSRCFLAAVASDLHRRCDERATSPQPSPPKEERE